MKEFAQCMLITIILAGAVLHSISEIYWATVALAEWIESTFFHKAGTKESE